MNLLHIEYVLEATKRLHTAQKALDKASTAEANAPLGDHRARNRARLAAEERDRAAHELHCRLVETGLTPAEPERYGTLTTCWNGCEWAEYRRAPDQARLTAWMESRAQAAA